MFWRQNLARAGYLLWFTFPISELWVNLTAPWPKGSPDTKVPEQKDLNEVRVVTECKTEHFLFHLIITDEPPLGCSGSSSEWGERKQRQKGEQT